MRAGERKDWPCLIEKRLPPCSKQTIKMLLTICGSMKRGGCTAIISSAAGREKSDIVFSEGRSYPRPCVRGAGGKKKKRLSKRFGDRPASTIGIGHRRKKKKRSEKPQPAQFSSRKTGGKKEKKTFPLARPEKKKGGEKKKFLAPH